MDQLFCDLVHVFLGTKTNGDIFNYDDYGFWEKMRGGSRQWNLRKILRCFWVFSCLELSSIGLGRGKIS